MVSTISSDDPACVVFVADMLKILEIFGFQIEIGSKKSPSIISREMDEFD